jgi:hypothetical protein
MAFCQDDEQPEDQNLPQPNQVGGIVGALQNIFYDPIAAAAEVDDDE